MKKILVLLMLSFTINAYATTVDDLVKRYGRQSIMEVFADKLKNKFTIEIDGLTRIAPAPSIDYITVATLTADIERAGMTTITVESALLEKIEQARKIELRKAEEERIIAKEAARRLAEEKERDRQKKIKEQNIRFKKAQEEIKLIAENEERDRQKKIEENKKELIVEKMRLEQLNDGVEKNRSSSARFEAPNNRTETAPAMRAIEKCDVDYNNFDERYDCKSNVFDSY